MNMNKIIISILDEYYTLGLDKIFNKVTIGKKMNFNIGRETECIQFQIDDAHKISNRTYSIGYRDDEPRFEDDVFLQFYGISNRTYSFDEPRLLEDMFSQFPDKSEQKIILGGWVKLNDYMTEIPTVTYNNDVDFINAVSNILIRMKMSKEL